MLFLVDEQADMDAIHCQAEVVFDRHRRPPLIVFLLLKEFLRSLKVLRTNIWTPVHKLRQRVACLPDAGLTGSRCRTVSV